MASPIQDNNVIVSNDRYTIKLSSDVQLTSSTGETFPVYEVTGDISNEELETYGIFGSSFEGEIDFGTISPNKEKKSTAESLRKNDEVHLKNLKWESGIPIHIGVIDTDTDTRYYSNMSSGSFSGYFTIKVSGDYKLFIKNVGYESVKVAGKVQIEEAN